MYPQLVKAIKARAAACTTTEEAEELYLETPDGSFAGMIYRARYCALRNPEAAAAAAACTAAWEAEELYSMVDTGDDDAEAIYEARCAELAVIEATAKAAACSNAEEAEELFDTAPDVSFVRAVFEGRWMELYLSEAG